MEILEEEYINIDHEADITSRKGKVIQIQFYINFN